MKDNEKKKEKKKGLFGKLFEGLNKTRTNIAQTFDTVFKRSNIDDEFFDELEEALIIADIGVSTTDYIIEQLRERIKQEKIKDTADAREVLIDIIAQMMSFDVDTDNNEKTVYLIVGVNGVGKTTTIGKMAYLFVQEGKKVVLAAADTFRAAASEQLNQWGERSKVNVVKHAEGADPAAVVFDAVTSAKAKDADILICDTAGRLHNKKNLMEELKKIGRVLEREWPEAKKEVILVLDATTGQNAIAQAKVFAETVEITGIILTKLDGTAKGGVVIGIKQELGIPVKFIGIGEGIDDLQEFDAKSFAKAIF